LDDLLNSVEEIIRIEGVRARAGTLGSSVLIEGAEPVGVALLFQHTPGVSWVAVGDSADSTKGLVSATERLAKLYLRKGRTFSVLAESGERETTPADVGGMLSSKILDAVPRVRTDEEKPDVRFRSVWEEGRGVVGVELKSGPGGTPVGKRTVGCLVSGGMHSSVLAWHALLSGYGVSLLHFKISEESLLQVAGLYAELSHRVDPRRLSLRVGEGVGIVEGLRQMKGNHVLLAGFHFECGRVPEILEGRVLAPLALMTEEEFERSFMDLSIRRFDYRQKWTTTGLNEGKWRSFGGVRTDANGVLDGLS
jgi:adenylyl- and sulfurtransferase ThiI